MDTCSFIRGLLNVAKELNHVSYLGAGIIDKLTNVTEVAGLDVANVFMVTFTIYAVTTLSKKMSFALWFMAPRLSLVAAWLKNKVQMLWQLLKQL